jgi:hypothetical protein
MNEDKVGKGARPILPWFRADSKRPLKPQLKKALVLKRVSVRKGGVRGALEFPALYLAKPPSGARRNEGPSASKTPGVER